MLPFGCFTLYLTASVYQTSVIMPKINEKTHCSIKHQTGFFISLYILNGNLGLNCALSWIKMFVTIQKIK